VKQLSILVTNVTKRVDLIYDIVKNLEKQAEGLSVDIMYLGDNQSMSVGKKRNVMINAADGLYVCFIDDDDPIHPEFVKKIYEGTKTGVDVVNYMVEYSDGTITRPVKYSLKYKRDQNTETEFLRIPNHLMAVKKKHAINAGYRDLIWGEDADYAKRLLPYLKTEHNINEILYWYKYNAETSTGQRNHRRQHARPIND
jgi:glycosyltransferase involved in cell wall biosynthesis